MGNISECLRDDGFRPTGQESPFDESGQLWENSHELVCDETGIVLNDTKVSRDVAELSANYPRYWNSRKRVLPGGYVTAYDWGTDDEDNFYYHQKS